MGLCPCANITAWRIESPFVAGEKVQIMLPANFFEIGAQLVKWYFIIGTPFMLAGAVIAFFVWKYRKLK